MATLPSFNESELERNIEKLKQARHACTFKLNLLRDAATSSLSPAHLSTFDGVENRLFNAAHRIFELEASEKERKKAKLGAVEGDDGDEIRNGLKKSVSLIGTFDTLAEDIARLKFGLEDAKSPAEAAQDTVEIVAGWVKKLKLDQKAQESASASKAAGPQASAPKRAAIKQEEGVPKPAKEVNWAPPGYSHVKAPFRKNPKRKLKSGQRDSTVKEPARFEIVHLLE